MFAVVMVFGAFVAVAGMVLFYLDKGSGQNRFVIFGQTLEVSTPALVIVILGCSIFALPILKPLWISSNPPTTPPTTLNPSSNEKKPVPDPIGSRTTSNKDSSTHETTAAGISAQITKFAYQGQTASIEITYRNNTDHDSNFCAQPDTWRIEDELNHASYGWPVHSSSGNAICDSADWRQMGPGDITVAFVELNCPTGKNDLWTFYAADLKQPVRGLRFERAP